MEDIIADTAAVMLLPPRDELLNRIPKTHPRLFIRPEDLPHLKALAVQDLHAEFEALQARCDALLKDPPPTAEPPKYDPQVGFSEEIWWGNRTYTQRALDAAATLAFTRLLGGKDAYGHEAKRILLECAKWDPVGSTGYLYND